MIEYYALYAPVRQGELVSILNEHSKDGWRVICSVHNMVILEREVREDMGIPKYSTYSYYKVEI